MDLSATCLKREASKKSSVGRDASIDKNIWNISASEMTYIVSGGALNPTHSLGISVKHKVDNEVTSRQPVVGKQLLYEQEQHPVNGRKYYLRIT